MLLGPKPLDLDKDIFYCPFCKGETEHVWSEPANFHTITETGIRAFEEPLRFSAFDVRVRVCKKCRNASLWMNDKVVFPDHGDAPRPSPDMPDDVGKYYGEASLVMQKSPRAAAALLRTALEVLCNHLNLGDKRDGLSKRLAESKDKIGDDMWNAMDVVRVLGNEAAHAGEINVNEKPETVRGLFVLINHIVQVLITHPKSVQNAIADIRDITTQRRR